MYDDYSFSFLSRLGKPSSFLCLIFYYTLFFPGEGVVYLESVCLFMYAL